MPDQTWWHEELARLHALPKRSTQIPEIEIFRLEQFWHRILAEIDYCNRRSYVSDGYGNWREIEWKHVNDLLDSFESADAQTLRLQFYYRDQETHSGYYETSQQGNLF